MTIWDWSEATNQYPAGVNSGTTHLCCDIFKIWWPMMMTYDNDGERIIILHSAFCWSPVPLGVWLCCQLFHGPYAILHSVFYTFICLWRLTPIWLPYVWHCPFILVMRVCVRHGSCTSVSMPTATRTFTTISSSKLSLKATMWHTHCHVVIETSCTVLIIRCQHDMANKTNIEWTLFVCIIVVRWIPASCVHAPASCSN